MIIDLADWRKVMGRLAAIFPTALPALEAMHWDRALAWYPQAIEVWKETWGRGQGR